MAAPLTAPPGAPPGWLPSWDRTIALFATAAAPPRGLPAAILPRVWPTKDAGSLLDYSVDCTGWLAPLGDTLAGCRVTGSDLVVLVARLGFRAVLWLAGGTPGQSYAMTLALTSGTGQAVTVPVAIAVSGGPGFGTPTPPALATEAGGTLLTEDGTPLATAAGQFFAALGVEGGAILQTESGLAINA